MKKVIILLLLIGIIIGAYYGYNWYRIKNTPRLVTLSKQEIDVYEEITLKDIIESINGTLIKNKKLDTNTIGEKEITFNYMVETKYKVPYTIKYTVVDKVSPIIARPNTYKVTVGTTEEDIRIEYFCGDNYDDHPICKLEGEYDLNEPGDYPVKYIGKDSSGNESTHEFTLRVVEKPKKSQSSSSNSSEEEYTDFNEIINKYKTDKTKIGIDISYWQGTIDFEKIKESGVEFAYIRVGRGNGVGKEYVEDKKFEEYIKGLNKVNIPVGVYFYSNANSEKDAIKEAKWILNKIKKYKVDLEIVYDWENWDYYQEYTLSFHHLTETYKSFQKTIEKAGYEAMLYGSKHYLEEIWFPVESKIWLAHYTEQTTYKGPYKVWQICDDGKIDGIKSLVDINIMYD